MFWRFGGYASNSAIDNLLDKSDVTLEELLDESDLIQELKQHNTKLIEFLREDNTLQRLLQYVVAPGPATKDDGDEVEHVEPQGVEAFAKGKSVVTAIKTSPATDSEQTDEEQEKAEKARLKYAYVACEVLSSETWSIVESLMADISYLQEFWDFLRKPPPLDPLQAGYFTKVNETLLDKKTEEMLEMFKSLPGIVPAMLQHVDCPVVMDLLLKIISLEKADGGQGIVDWLQSQDLIPILLTYLSPECPSSTQTSAGDFLKAIITISANASQNEQSCIGPNSLTRQLVSEPCMETLVSSMLHGGNPLTVGVGIVIEVIRKNNSDYDPENGHNPEAPPTNHDPIYLGTLLRMFANHVPDFMSLILSPKHTITDGDGVRIADRGKLNSAWGTQIEPLGFDRFKTCELMAELLHCSNMGLLNEGGGEDFVRQRDEERERMRADGAFAPRHEEDDSAVDISEESTRFANGNNSTAGESPEELRGANSSEEDGFEQVISPGKGEDFVSNEDSTVSDEAFTEIQERSKFEADDKPPDEPLSPQVRSIVDSIDDEINASSPISSQPTSESSRSGHPTANLEETVQRINVEDESVPAPSDEQGELSAAQQSSIADVAATGRSTASGLSPLPEDKPTPLFSAMPRSTPPPAPLNSNNATPKPTEAGLDSSEAREPQAQGDGSVQVERTLSLPDASFETDLDGKPVVGDYLKLMFVEHKVVPTILSFFFRFPWNNFLHNVVYDVVQQVFNGPMERGYNRSVAIDLFETGSITQEIVDGQRRSDEAQQSKNMRLGYMGHLTLVAEEVVKFSERHPAELLSQKVMDKVLERSWIDYVEQTLSETRERDNAILGGVRPDMSVGPRQAVLNAVNASQGLGNSTALANAGLNGAIGGQPGLDSIDLSNSGSPSSASFTPWSGNLLSGFGSSSDDEDEDMDEGQEDDPGRAAAAAATTLATADVGPADDTQAGIPLIPPPPAPLNVPPSRARRQLARRLAMHKRQAEEAASNETAVESEASARRSEDPFASLGDDEEEDEGTNDDEEDEYDGGDGQDPFTFDEEEEDITVSGRRDRGSHPSSSVADRKRTTRSNFKSLFFPSYPGVQGGADGTGDGEDDDGDDSHLNQRNARASGRNEHDEHHDSSSDSESPERAAGPVEAKRIRQRIPLETGEDDEDDGDSNIRVKSKKKGGHADHDDSNDDNEENGDAHDDQDDDDDEMGDMIAPSEEALDDADTVSADAEGHGEVDRENEMLGESSPDRGDEQGEDLSAVEKQKLRTNNLPDSGNRHKKGHQAGEEESEDDQDEEEEAEGEGLVEIAMSRQGGSGRTSNAAIATNSAVRKV